MVFCRHGQTAWNAVGRFQGQLDPPLDATGEAQAVRAAGLLATMRPDVLISSDLQRAVATAAPLAQRCGLTAEADERLREIWLGEWQGLTTAEAKERFPDEHESWMQGRDIRRGGGETYAEAGARAVAAVRERLDAVPTDGTLVAVTHGGTARAALGTLLELPADSWWRLAPVGNAQWSIAVAGKRGWRLAEHNAGTPLHEAIGDDAR